MVSDEFVMDKILGRIDLLDTKFDKKITTICSDVGKCNTGIALVKKDMDNFLKTKSDEIDSSKRRIYIGMGLITILFTAYASFKEFIH